MMAKGKIVILIIIIFFFFTVIYVDLTDSIPDRNDDFIGASDSIASPTNSTCYSCHTRLSGVINDEISKPAIDWEQSIHYSEKSVVMCSKCHGGDFSTNITSDAKSESAGYNRNMGKQDKVEICGSCHEPEFNEFQKSLHWSQEDNNSKITCTDCHSNHNIRPSGDKDSTIFVTTEPKICGKCHEEEYNKYFNTFHGKQLNLGNSNVAVCSDCHNAHFIAPRSDPNSSINPSNFPKTCSKCHDNDLDIKVSDGSFHNDKESHTPNLLFNKDELDGTEKFYYIGPFDLGFYIPFVFSALKVLTVFSLVTIIFIETIFIKVFRRK
jgi:hypothetical protein